MSTESDFRIYSTCVRPILTYGSITRHLTETSIPKELMRNTTMKTLRSIKTVELSDQIRINSIREELEVDDMVRSGRR